MPIPILAALWAGGTLVPHVSGGLIVTGASGYVTGTYVSSLAVSSALTAAGTVLGAGALTLSGVGAAIIGSAGLFGTTVGASGLTGVLMSAGIIPATPIAVPIAASVGLVGLGGLSFVLFKLRRKIARAAKGEEVQFSELEAKIIEAVLRRAGKKGDGGPPPSE